MKGLERPSSGMRRRSRGQGLVEFALVFPVLVLLLFGVLDMGRAVYAYSTIGNAARQGARVAAVNQIFNSNECVQDMPVETVGSTHTSITACAIRAAQSLNVQAGDVHVAYSAPVGTSLSCPAAADTTPSSGQLDLGCIASVTVDYTFTPLTPVISQMFASIPMASTSQMPIERLLP
jgi:Flp pilus assembly protein TadG